MAALVNSERFVDASGQKTFFSQKQYYIGELEKLNQKHKEAMDKKKKWKDRYFTLKTEYDIDINRLYNALDNFRNFQEIQKSNAEIQTEVDNSEYNKMLMNHNAVKSENRLVIIYMNNYFHIIVS